MTASCRQCRTRAGGREAPASGADGCDKSLQAIGRPAREPCGASARSAAVPEQRALLWSVAHELRAPLSALTIAADLMASEASELAPQELCRLAQKIQCSALWLRDTVDSLLSPAAIESGSLRIERTPTLVRDIVEDILPVVDPLLSARDQRLQLRHRGRPHTVLADRQRIGQVIVNLLSNASKYSPPSTPIDLTIDARESWVRVITADRGPGLTPALQRRVFEPHVRAECARQSGADGVGLGLAIVKTIVRAHGGRVGVRNRAHGGARFWLELPVHAEAPVSIRSLPASRCRKTG